MAYRYDTPRQAGAYTYAAAAAAAPASRSFRHGSALVPGAYRYGGYGGLGVPGSQVPSTGVDGPAGLYNDLSLPADANKEVRALVVRWPANGVLTVFEDSSFVYTGASDSFDYRLYVDGVDAGTATVQLVTAG